MKTLSETFKGKVAAIALASSTLLAAFSAPSLGAESGKVCVTPPSPSSSYSMADAIQITKGHGGQIGVLGNPSDNIDNVLGVRETAETLKEDGVRAVYIPTSTVPVGHVQLMFAGLTSDDFRYRISDQLGIAYVAAGDVYKAERGGNLIALSDPCAAQQLAAAITPQ